MWWFLCGSKTERSKEGTIHSFIPIWVSTYCVEWAPTGRGEATTSKIWTETHFLFQLGNFKQGKQLIDWKVTWFIFLIGKKCEILPSPKAPGGPGVEICCLWWKTKTTVFAFCFHTGIKTQRPLATVQATTWLCLSTIYNIEYYYFGIRGHRAGRQC